MLSPADIECGLEKSSSALDARLVELIEVLKRIAEVLEEIVDRG